MSLDIELRPYNGDHGTERGLVISSWLLSYGRAQEVQRATDLIHGGDLRVYHRAYEPRIRALMARSTITVACIPSEPSAIMGWCAREADRLHYLYVKPRWRRLGVATHLLAELRDTPLVYTHRTPMVDARARERQGLAPLRIPPAWRYAPMARWEDGDANPVGDAA